MVTAKEFMVDTLRDSHPKEYAKKLDREMRAVLNLNEFQFDLPPRVVQTIKDEAPNAAKYVYFGDGPTSELTEKIADYVGLKKENIAIDESLDQALNRFPKLFVNKGDNVVMMDPTYPELFFGNRRAGGITKKISVENPELNLNPDKILEAIDERTRIAFLCNPNNPTGLKMEREDIMKVVENANCVVLVDECYHEYCDETVADQVNDYENLYVLRSFSKGFGLAGAKMCYMIGCADAIDVYNRIMSGFEYNRYGTYAAIAALDSLDDYKAIWATVAEEKKKIASELTAAGYKVWPSSSSFNFLDVSVTGMTGTEVRDALRDTYSVLTRDVNATFDELDNKYISFATAKADMNDYLINALKELAK